MPDTKRDREKKHEYVYVSCEDWSGFYIDGELARENHRLDIQDCLKLVGIECEYLYGDYAINSDGRLPCDLTDVREALAEQVRLDKELEAAEGRVAELKMRLKRDT